MCGVVIDCNLDVSTEVATFTLNLFTGVVFCSSETISDLVLPLIRNLVFSMAGVSFRISKFSLCMIFLLSLVRENIWNIGTVGKLELLFGFSFFSSDLFMWIFSTLTTSGRDVVLIIVSYGKDDVSIEFTSDEAVVVTMLLFFSPGLINGVLEWRVGSCLISDIVLVSDRKSVLGVNVGAMLSDITDVGIVRYDRVGIIYSLDSGFTL